MRRVLTLLAVAGLALLPTALRGDESPSNEELETRIRAAITRAVPLIEKASTGSAKERKCFTCHNQAMPVLAIAEAKRRGFEIDSAILEEQVLHTYRHLERGKKNYKEGKGQGGQVDTAGYALWALSAGERPADEVTDAVTVYLAKHHADKETWKASGNRPPSEKSAFTATYLALRALNDFGRGEVEDAIAQRRLKAAQWLDKADPQDTEDQIFRIRAWQLLDLDEAKLNAAVKDLVWQQQEDGGWRQKDDMESDAYATGSVLATFAATSIEVDQEVIRRGIEYLLKTQQEDGSWLVVTRSKPFQTYYETGFPHEKNQFISCSATCWATLALLSRTNSK